MPQNTPEHLLNIKECLIIIRNLYVLLKTYRVENASETFWNVSKAIRTDNNASHRVRKPQNVRPPLRTFTNISRTTQNPWDASEFLATSPKLHRMARNMPKRQRTPDNFQKPLKTTHILRKRLRILRNVIERVRLKRIFQYQSKHKSTPHNTLES